MNLARSCGSSLALLAALLCGCTSNDATPSGPSGETPGPSVRVNASNARACEVVMTVEQGTATVRFSDGVSGEVSNAQGRMGVAFVSTNGNALPTNPVRLNWQGSPGVAKVIQTSCYAEDGVKLNEVIATVDS